MGSANSGYLAMIFVMLLVMFAVFALIESWTRGNRFSRVLALLFFAWSVRISVSSIQHRLPQFSEDGYTALLLALSFPMVLGCGWLAFRFLRKAGRG